MIRPVRLALLAVWVCALAAAFPQRAPAQFVNDSIINNNIGGVMIDADGALAAAPAEQSAELVRVHARAMQDVGGDLAAKTELRMISLRQLDAALRQALDAGEPVPQEMLVLAGLQRVQYVFVDQARQDVILAGPAEGWKVDRLGQVVGVTSGQPVLLLDDLASALRARRSSAQNVITCSIDPTPEGLARLQSVASDRRLVQASDQAVKAKFEQALGPQVITVTGVPVSSHFARTLVAADFRMKRLAMGFDKAPIPGLPSYLSMLRGTRSASSLPRWWLAPAYEPLATDGNQLAWQLRGPGVKCLTDSDLVNAQGEKIGRGRTDRAAEAWAAKMSDRFPELAEHDSTFGKLRNLMDLAVAAALVEQQNLLTAYDLQLDAMLNRYPAMQFHAAQTVASQATLMRKRGSRAITVSGGVEVQPWKVVQQPAVEDASLAELQQQATGERANWWWDAPAK